MGHFRLADQFLKERPVMNHRLPQVLSRGLTVSLANRDFVGFTVIIDHKGMVHRNIRRPLFKVSYRVASG